MTDRGAIDLHTAAEDFRRARGRAALVQIVDRLRGRPPDLLSYEDVRKRLNITPAQGPRTLREIPLPAIVGSVGRYTDFTRGFLPKTDSDKDRWVRVMQGMTSMAGLPPIEVYQLGEAYFVLDGNHRVSVARQLGAERIEAYVTVIPSRVSLTPDTRPDDLIIKAEYVAFLEATRLDSLRPEADLSVTAPGQYPVLLEHIAVHRYFMGLERQGEVPYEEAVTHWYDQVYLPVIREIRAQGILGDFPRRTETDLYLWMAEHRAELARELGWELGPEVAVADLVPQDQGLLRRLVGAVTPDELEAGPPPGEWRTAYLAARRDERLFSTLLVPVSGEEVGWQGLDQALGVARREGSQLYGLHVVPSEAQKESAPTRVVQAEFNRRCAQAGVPGRLALVVGKVPRQICGWSRWADLIVLNLAYPPPPQPLARLGSGFRTVLLNCPRPVLAVPGVTSPLSRGLLAFDGSPKSEEGLFVATYLASRWQLPLAVVTVLESERASPETQVRARAYLEQHGVAATYVQERGPVGEAILRAAEAQGADLLILGGYGYSPVVEMVLGSTVDEVLRKSRRPALICR